MVNRVRQNRIGLLVSCLVLLAPVIAGCAADELGRTLLVPRDFPSIQAAVDSAQSGDLVLIDEGIYKESVTVKTDNIVIRGVDRNSVILDGSYTLTDGIRVAGANGVAIENITARNFAVNGFYWIGSIGYRGSYLTAVRNGFYGIYAFDSRGGVFEHSYASGSFDAGFYIGQCVPCDAVITNSIAEFNGLGYSGTNASQNLKIVNSVFRLNRAGIMPNSGDYEKYAPQRDAIFAGNQVYSNNNLEAPAFAQIAPATGNGIVIAGGLNNLVTKNRVWDHDIAGIAVIPNILGVSFPAKANIILGNDVSGSGLADLAIAESEESTNCFAENSFMSSKPQQIEKVRPCKGVGISGLQFFPIATVLARDLPRSPSNQTVKDPAPQLVMPNAKSGKRTPASSVPPTVDIDKIVMPSGPNGD
jgi:hypothetical protein